MKTPTFLSFFLSLCISTLLNAQVDSFNLYYDLGIYELKEDQTSFLQQRFDSLSKQHKYKLLIKGSADFIGTPESNQVLSENRAKAVFKFVDQYYDTLITANEYLGLGEMPFTGDERKQRRGVQEDRKVVVFIEELQPKKEKLKTKLGVLEAGKNLVINNLNFHPGRHVLIKESVPTLKALLKILEENPDLEIEIEGHICCHAYKDGGDGYDTDAKEYKLSENRAKNIYNYLVRKGIDEQRLSFKGYGFQRPLYYPERSPTQQKLNRRVEIKILKL